MPKVYKKQNQGIVLIKKSNNLVESRYKFDIWETRFFLSILSNIQKENTDFKTYRIRYKDVIKTFGLKSGDAYASLRDAAKSLMRKTVRTSYSLNGVAREQERNLISTIDYMAEGQVGTENHEYIDVVVHEEMKPFLLQLSKNFTAYDLRNVAQLGVYSIRLYELLKQYESIGSRTLKVDEMKAMFELNTEYPKYNDFYRWVIKPSEAEINKHTDLSIIEIEKLKEGRKVVALRFKFKAKTAQELTKLRKSPFQETLFDSLPEPEIVEISEDVPEQVNVVVIDKIVAKGEKKPKKPNNAEGVSTETVLPNSDAQDKLIFELSPFVVTKFGVSFKVFMGLIEQYTEGVIRQAVQVTETAMQTGKIDNVAGFFVEAVRGKYTDPKLKQKQVEVAQKTKIAQAKKEEVNVEMMAKAQKQLAYQQEMTIFMQLIQEDKHLVEAVTDKIRLGILGTYYNTAKSFEENLKHPLLQVAFLSAVKEAKPDSFDIK
jgi:plasmid replication initiation protein